MMSQKTSPDELAIFGGQPAFQEAIHVGRPNVINRDGLLQRFNAILDRCWFTNNGPVVQEFERAIEKYLGVRHCIATCNATVALEIAIRALELQGEVIVPSFTFIATVHALQWQQTTPVFCDIDPQTHTIDPLEIEALITPRTTGIIGVHTWGRPCDIDALQAIAEERNLTLMFDAAHAFGCSYKGRMIGTFGQAEVFSFHATKFLSTFEGGAVTANDDELASRIRLMKNFGFAGYDNVIYIGTNGKMPEVAAAMGLTSLECVDELIACNERNHSLYKKTLAGLPGVLFKEYDKTEKSNYQYIVVEIDESASALSRDNLQRILWAENILARRYFYPGCHRMEPYRSYPRWRDAKLENTDRLCNRVLSLPTGTTIDSEAITCICSIIKVAVENGNKISERLSVEQAGMTPP
jgi:dTDP-4-amino-4,6-dideoxygalactose transaminase